MGLLLWVLIALAVIWLIIVFAAHLPLWLLVLCLIFVVAFFV